MTDNRGRTPGRKRLNEVPQNGAQLRSNANLVNNREATTATSNGEYVGEDGSEGAIQTGDNVKYVLDPTALYVYAALAELLDTLTTVRAAWDGPEPLEAVDFALRAVLEFLDAVDCTNPDDRHAPLFELWSAISSLRGGAETPLLKPARPLRGRPRQTVAEHDTRSIAVAISDTIAEHTRIPREEADCIVADELKKLGYVFGNSGLSAAKKASPEEALARHRQWLGQGACPDGMREAHKGHKHLFRDLWAEWQTELGPGDPARITRRLLDILKEKVIARRGRMFRRERSKN